MRAVVRSNGATLCAALLAATFCICTRGTGAPPATAEPRTPSLSGRLSAPEGVSLAGTIVVAEELVGGRTATVRSLGSASDAAGLEAMIGAAQAGGPSTVPGVYTTTASANGHYAFYNLPHGRYTVMARQGDRVGLQIGVEVGGAKIAQATILQVAGTGTIEGKVRYDQPNVTTPDNSGIMVFVEGTSLMAFSQGSSGDYSILNVPVQSTSAPLYRVIAVASGFADQGTHVPQRLVSDSVNAPLIFLTHGAYVVGRVIDPTISDPNKQQIAGATIVVATGQSATSDADGYFLLQGLKTGGNYVTVTKSPYKIYRKQFGPVLGNALYILPIALQK